MIKKKILIIGSDMEIGGAERALLGLLDAIDTERFEVDLFLLRHQGPFLKLIPSKINLLPENPTYADLGVPIGYVIKKGHIKMALSRALGKINAKRYIKQHNLPRLNSVENHYSFLYTKWLLPKISSKKYDLTISFTVPYYLAPEKADSLKTVAWLHTDYRCVEGNTNKELIVWDAHDKIASISTEVTKAFLSKFPTLEKKIVEIENIVAPAIIREQAEAFDVIQEMPSEPGIVKLLSIGRFCDAKNFDNIPEICSYIVGLGGKVRWYIIGFGGDEQLIQSKIREWRMENYVFILGKKENPYPYIKACDLYIQPSRFEGKAVTVREAQILNKPVIITNYPTAASQIEDGRDGIIVPMDNWECAKGIYNIIKDIDVQQALIEFTKNNNYVNNDEVQKIYDLME